MSWLSNKTGRPKEDGGHTRINISVDQSTADILRLTENKSQYVEYCVSTCTYSRHIKFCQPNEATNDDSLTFRTAATFTWIPVNASNNVIIATYCHFNYRCSGEGFKFRLCVNGSATSPIEGLVSNVWAQSTVYSNSSFEEWAKVLPNQSKYTVEFQFAPQCFSDIAYVKDVTILLDVTDGMPALPSDF